MQPNIKQKNVEMLLDYIDENILCSKNEIINGLKKKAGWLFEDFKIIIKDNAEFSIYSYIRKRKLYFSFCEMQAYPHKTNEVIAGFYFDASASQLCRSFKAEFGVTITEAKANPCIVKDNRINADKWYMEATNEKEELLKMETSSHFTEPTMKVIEILDYAEKEYGFSPDLCYDIGKIAERLGVPIHTMIDSCFNTMADVHSNQDYIPPEYDTMIDMNISSIDELNDICSFFGCRYWELDRCMVEAYSSGSVEI